MTSTNLPVKFVRLLQLPNIQCASLADELDAASARTGVVERDEHNVRQVHARQLDVEHVGRRLDLGLQPVRRPAEHHHRACEFEDELLPTYDLGDVPRDLHP